MNFDDEKEYEENESEESSEDFDEEELELVRSKVKGVSDSIRIVQLSITKWMKSPLTPPPNEDGFHILELGYRKVEKPIKRFLLDWPDGNIEAIAENIVLSAGIDLANSAAESESYVVRIFGGNDSRTFRLLLIQNENQEDDEEDERPVRQSRAMTAPVRAQMVHHDDGLFGAAPEIAQNAFALQLNHNVELVRQNKELMQTFIEHRTNEAKSTSKIIKEQQETINKLVKDRFETLEARDEIYSRKSEIDAQVREEERKALREEKIEQKLEQIFTKFVLPAVAGKFGMGALVQAAQMPPSDGQNMTRSKGEGEPLTQAEMVVHSFFSTIRPDQLASVLQENTIKFDDEQKANLIEMLQVLQAQYTKSDPEEQKQESRH